MPAERLHATCVTLGGQGVLITGASGRGKSTLALGLISLGAQLVADDQVCLHSGAANTVIATRPATLPPLIEARGVGLLQAPLARSARIALSVDMNIDETERLPPLRQITLLGLAIPLLYRGPSLCFPQSVAHLLRHGRRLS